MKNYVMTFTIRVGEVEHLLHRLIQVKDDETPADAVHEALKDFWGEESTVEESYGHHYHRDWQESLKLESYEKVDEVEYEDLQTHLPVWRRAE